MKTEELNLGEAGVFWREEKAQAWRLELRKADTMPFRRWKLKSRQVHRTVYFCLLPTRIPGVVNPWKKRTKAWVTNLDLQNCWGVFQQNLTVQEKRTVQIRICLPLLLAVAYTWAAEALPCLWYKHLYKLIWGFMALSWLFISGISKGRVPEKLGGWLFEKEDDSRSIRCSQGIFVKCKAAFYNQPWGVMWLYRDGRYKCSSNPHVLLQILLLLGPLQAGGFLTDHKF